MSGMCLPSDRSSSSAPSSHKRLQCTSYVSTQQHSLTCILIGTKKSILSSTCVRAAAPSLGSLVGEHPPMTMRCNINARVCSLW